MSKRKNRSLPQESRADDSAVVYSSGGSSASGTSSGASSKYYARIFKRSLCCCCCTAACFVVLLLLTGTVTFYDGFVTDGHVHGLLVDLFEQPALSASLNRSVEPCRNFYHFVCDGWLAQKGMNVSVIEELALSARRSAATLLRHVQVPAVGAFDVVHKAALLMEKCLLLSRRPPRPEVLLHFMNDIGLTWPQPTSMATPDLINLMVRLSLSWELSAIFELELLPTPKAAGGRPRWRLSPSNQLSLWRKERKRIGAEYLTRIRRHVEAFSAADVTRSLIDSVFEADDEVLRVTNVYKAEGESTPFGELDEIAPGFQAPLWLAAMNNVTRGYFEVHAIDVVSVSNTRFLAALQRLVGEMNTRKPHVVPLYLSWHVLRSLSWTVAPDARELQLDSEPEREQRCFRTAALDTRFDSINWVDTLPLGLLGYRAVLRADLQCCAAELVYGTSLRLPVDFFTSAQVHGLMPMAAGKPFADSANWEMGTIEKLFQAAKREYSHRIERCQWMDEATRRSAQNKIRSVRGVFPAPGLVWNASALQRVYECMPQDREAFFLPSLLAAKRCKHKLILSTAATGATSPDTITWTSPVDYLVRYLDVYNSAVVMGSVLRPPVFHVIGTHKEVFNYAGLAFLFARLLFGAIDQKGSLRDGTGSLRPWWSNSTRDGYSAAVRCLEDLYQFDARFIGNEISDAVATSVAFAAYQRHVEEFFARNRGGLRASLVWAQSWTHWFKPRSQGEFTEDQAFFMNHCFCFCSRKVSSLYSAGWTSPEEKCNLPLRNSPDFWRAFDCRRGDAMRAEKSCQLI